MENQIKFVDKKEAGKILGISQVTLRKWLKSDKINLSETTVGLRKRIALSEIEKLKKELTQKNY